MHKLFPSQMDDEQIHLVVREHWVHLAWKVLIWVCFAAALILFNRFFPANLPALFQGTWGQITLLFTQIYTMLLALSLFLIFIFYYLNIGVITNIRLVDVDQSGLFSHTINELHIDKIEDVSSKITGLFGTLFNYGDVIIETAGATTENFVFDKIPNPAGLEKMILDLYEKNSNFAKEGREENKI